MDAKYPTYLEKLEDNLLHPFSAPARLQFASGRGSELKDGKYPAKIRALHSSSALVVNVFDYWTLIDKSIWTSILDLPYPLVTIDYECTPPMPTGKAPPNPDVVLALANNQLIAIESKFMEWTEPTDATFENAYFEGNINYWTNLGLSRCQLLADQYRDKTARPFVYLNAPQLLKHALGLANTLGTGFELWYIYFDFDEPMSDTHKDEIDKFKSLLDVELQFKAFRYQEIVSKLALQAVGAESDYLKTLRERYCL